ncbi:MAG: DUF421 domain-containing protein [Armatimonadetes bacterium]|nr:DUF421 domain-containing protein [Armatimonadota bacterium]
MHPEPLLRAALSTTGIFLLLLVGLRTLGRRQSAQLSALDLLIILLLGSAVETSLIGVRTTEGIGLKDPNVSLSVGLVSALTLMLVDYLLGRISIRFPNIKRMISGDPLILLRNGEPVEENLYRAGMTHDDLQEAIRRQGFDDFKEARYVVMETSGELDVVAAEKPKSKKIDNKDT